MKLGKFEIEYNSSKRAIQVCERVNNAYGFDSKTWREISYCVRSDAQYVELIEGVLLVIYEDAGHVRDLWNGGARAFFSPDAAIAFANLQIGAQ